MEMADAALILGLLVIIAVLLRRQWKKPKDKQSVGTFDSDQEHFETPSPASGRREVEGAMEKSHLESGDFSSEMIAEMETRARKLDHLVQEADGKIAELKKVLSELKNDNFRKDVASDDARFSDVYKLADSGVDTVEIARRTGKKPGEIELILGLRNHKET